MIDLKKAFAALPPPAADPRDAEAARHVWLRARIDAVVGNERRRARATRLRIASASITIVALDAIVPLLLASVGQPLAALVAATAVTHAAASLSLLRT
jgi:hypothetical protein